MPVVVKLNYLRIAPRKVRLVTDLIRKKKVEEAQTILNFTRKKAAEPLFKLLKTAIADARNNFQLDPANLYISKITVDEGPRHKRWMPRARGAAYKIQKKTSHVTLVLDDITPAKEVKKIKRAKKKETKEPSKIEKPKKGAAKAAPTGRAKLRPEAEAPKPKVERGIKRIFRRKAF